MAKIISDIPSVHCVTCPPSRMDFPLPANPHPSLLGKRKHCDPSSLPPANPATASGRTPAGGGRRGCQRRATLHTGCVRAGPLLIDPTWKPSAVRQEPFFLSRCVAWLKIDGVGGPRPQANIDPGPIFDTQPRPIETDKFSAKNQPTFSPGLPHSDAERASGDKAGLALPPLHPVVP